MFLKGKFSLTYLNKSKSILAVILSLQIFTTNTTAGQRPIYNSEDIFHPVIAKNGMSSLPGRT